MTSLRERHTTLEGVDVTIIGNSPSTCATQLPYTGIEDREIFYFMVIRRVYLASFDVAMGKHFDVFGKLCLLIIALLVDSWHSFSHIMRPAVTECQQWEGVNYCESY